MVRLVKKERKQQVNEMAQPLHYKVVLKVPFDNTSPDSPLEVVFISKTTKSRGYTHRYIDMSDSEPQHRNQVNKQIELTDDSDDRTSNNLKDREREEVRQSGLIVMNQGTEQTLRMEIGEVVAVGEGRTLNNGTVLPLSIKAGQQVIYNKYAGTQIMSGEDKFLIVKETDILAIVK